MKYVNGILFLDKEFSKNTVPLELKKLENMHDNPIKKIDLSHVKKIDTAGVAAIEYIIDTWTRHGDAPIIINASPIVDESLKTFSATLLSPLPTPRQVSLFEKFGTYVFVFLTHVWNFILLAADTFYWGILGIFSSKGRRKGEVINQSILIGVNALPIIALVSFLVGFILALQSAQQLRQFGANIFIADLIAISMTREMGPLMTAIVLAGRSGSAISSEIATMKISEEIDALHTMALNPIKFIVLPKLYALTLVTPLLTIFADVLGIAGGFFIGITYLKLSPTAFINEIAKVMVMKDIITSLIKSFAFAWVIGLVGVYFGFSASGGAEDVGRATTSSVVTAIFMVIVTDSLLGLLFY